MREPRWLPRLAVEAAHLDALRANGGRQGFLDEANLDEALARARQKWTYEENKPDLAVLAAAYGFGLARNHPFIDGNKRIAFLGMAMFLGINGYEIDTTELDVVQTMLPLAAGELSESALAEWVRKCAVRLPRGG
jgi:death-on-curing protein